MHKFGWLVLALAVGCQKSPGVFDESPAEQPPAPAEQPAPYPPPAEQPGAYADPSAPPPIYGEPGIEAPGQLGQAPAQIQGLRQHAQQMRTAENFQSTDLVAALRDLSTAFAVLPNAGAEVTDAASRILSFADRIEASGTDSNMHGRWAEHALTEAVAGLESYQKEQGVAGLESRIDTLRGQIDALDDEKAFMDQKDQFANVYEQIADTLAMAASPVEEPIRGTE